MAGSTKSYDPADYAPEKMAGDAAALLDHLGLRAGPCHGLFDGRAGRGLPGAGRAGDRWRRWCSAGSASAWSMASATGIRSPRRCWRPIRRPSSIAAARPFAPLPTRPSSDRRALAACIATSRTLITEAEMARIAPADPGRGRHDGRHRRVGRRNSPRSCRTPRFSTSLAATTCCPLATAASRQRVVCFLRSHPL